LAFSEFARLTPDIVNVRHGEVHVFDVLHSPSLGAIIAHHPLWTCAPVASSDVGQGEDSFTWRASRGGSNDQMTSQNALANAKLLFKALAAREANLDEPIPNIRITDVAVQIGLQGDEFDSALDYAADHGWFEDAEVGDSANWFSLTPAGVAAAKS
jgi:hypothetical protein